MRKVPVRVFVPLVAAFSTISAAEVPVADFAGHDVYQQVKIAPDGAHLAATTVVSGQTVLALVHLPDMATKLKPGDVMRAPGFLKLDPKAYAEATA